MSYLLAKTAADFFNNFRTTNNVGTTLDNFERTIGTYTGQLVDINNDGRVGTGFVRNWGTNSKDMLERAEIFMKRDLDGNGAVGNVSNVRAGASKLTQITKKMSREMARGHFRPGMPAPRYPSYGKQQPIYHTQAPVCGGFGGYSAYQQMGFAQQPYGQGFSQFYSSQSQQFSFGPLLGALNPAFGFAQGIADFAGSIGSFFGYGSSQFESWQVGTGGFGIPGGGQWNTGGFGCRPCGGRPMPYVHPGCSGKVVAANGRVWGDPHFDAACGGKFDVQGEPGKIYNLLSDRGVQVNAKFVDAGNQTTVIGDLGILSGRDQVQIGANGLVTVNGRAIQPGGCAAIAGGSVHYNKDGRIGVKTGEYDIVATRVDGRLDVNFNSKNVNADGVMPHGLWGQTADGDNLVRHSTGKQGEGAIAGNYKEYEVSNLFDPNFKYSKYYGNAPTGGFYDNVSTIDMLERAELSTGVDLNRDGVIGSVGNGFRKPHPFFPRAFA